MNLAWFVHALNTSSGREIVQEFLDAAKEVRFPVDPVITWAEPGMWEEHTVNKARAWSLDNPDGHVLYMHTKGAFHESMQNGFDFQKLWRWEMTDRLLRAWPARVSELREYDTSGVWWWEPEDASPGVIRNHFYAGNFWWARASYLATLPEIPVLTEEIRNEAELWVGSGDLRPKWMKREWVECFAPGSILEG